MKRILLFVCSVLLIVLHTFPEDATDSVKTQYNKLIGRWENSFDSEAYIWKGTVCAPISEY